MAYPAHVQALLDSLTEEQRVFQIRCIRFLSWMRLTVGFALVVAVGLELWGYSAGNPFALRVFEVYRPYAGSFPEYSFPLWGVLLFVLGIYMLTRRGY